MARTLADMTPEEARDVLKNLRLIEETPIHKGRHDEGLQELRVNALHAATATRHGIRSLETLAAERLEYGVTAVIGGRRLIMSNTRHGNTMDGMGRWFPMKELAEDFMRTVTAPEPRLVTRRASTYWEATDE